jgi:DNA polymerase-3 subunit alpha
MLGLYVSDHPLMGAQQALSRHIESTLTEAKEMNDGAPTTLGGVVTALNRRYTKRGDLMATFVLEDLEAAMEVFVFPRTMGDFGHLLEEDSVVAVKGRIDRRDDQAKFIAMEVKRPELVMGEGPPVRLKIPASRLTETLVAEIKRILEAHPGDSGVLLHVEDGRRTTVLRLGAGFCVNAGNALHAELRVLLGAESVF